MASRQSIKAYALAGLSTLVGMSRAMGRPVVLTIEPTNICNLKCPVCETGAGILRRTKGYMSLADFKFILDNVGRQVNTILLYFMGETFLNKEAYAMISEAHCRGIYVSVCTNGDFVDGHKLVESGVNEVSFQIGGITQKTHEVYRRGSDLGRVVDNIREAVQARDYEHIPVKLKVGFIIMRHNENEVLSLPQWAIQARIDYEIVNSCVRNIEQGKEFLPENLRYWFYDKASFDKGILIPKVVPHNCCDWLYYSTVITWDGNVLPCCRDAQGDYVMGNALKDDFGDIWNGLRYKQFRRIINRDQKRMKLCRLCSGYGIPRLR